MVMKIKYALHVPHVRLSVFWLVLASLYGLLKNGQSEESTSTVRGFMAPVSTFNTPDC